MGAAIGSEADDSYSGDSPLGDLLFPRFRSATPYLAMATHHWATCFSSFPGCDTLSCNGDSPLGDLLFLLSGVRHLIFQRQLTTEQLAFPFFRGTFLDFATITHLWVTCFFPLPGCDTLSFNDNSPLDDLLFPSFRGVAPDFATATHLWTTCFFPLSGVQHLTLQRQLTSGRLAFSFFQGEFPIFNTLQY